MDRKDDPKGKEETPLSSSQELFEDIFKRATLEIKREKADKTQSQQPTQAPAPVQGQQRQEKLPPPSPRKPQTVRRPAPVKAERAETSPRSTEKRTESSPPPKGIPKTDKRNLKRFGAPKAALLVILLVVLAGAVLSYTGIIDISPVLNYLGFGHEQVAQAPVPPKRSVKLPEKAVTSPTQQKEQVPAPSPAPKEATPAPVSKVETQAEPKPPTTTAQAGSDAERIEGKAPSASTQEHPKPAEVAVKQEPQPAPAEAQASAKPGATEVSPPQPPRTPQYPYSVYLGSHNSPEAVRKAISEYQGKELSPYWAKVDLGEKGVWFRVFAGYFQNKEETEKFIKDQSIPGATPGITKYANWIGTFESDKHAEDQKQALLSAGFYPYTIKGADGKTLLYSGAFDRKEYAEKERSALASKGIRSEVVER